MVGVPGRSKGCNTCIQRKVKCDQGKPTCGNCAKAKRICGGYQRKTGWVFSSDVELPVREANALTANANSVICHGRWTNKQSKQSKNRHGPRQSSSLSPKEEELGTGMSHYTFVIDESATPSPLSSPSPIQAISNLSAQWEQLRNAFIGMYLPDTLFISSRRVDGVTGNWLTELKGESIASKALETAVAACASVQVGQDKGDMKLISQGREIYQASLQHMRAALANSELRSTDATLAACMALSLYELFANRMGDDCMYEAHAKGAMALLQMRGPDSLQSPLAHSIFLGLRRQIVLNCLVKHEVMFINKGPWTAKPWGKYKKNSVDRCLDALYMLPPIQIMLDDARRETEPTKIRQLCLKIVDNCWKVDAFLQQWYEEVEKSHVGPMYWPVFSSTRGDHGKPNTFSTVFEFSHFSISYQLTTYWSGLYVTHEVLKKANEMLAELDPLQADEFNAAVKRSEETWMRHSRNVCQSHEFFMKRENGRAGLLVGLAMVKGCYYNFMDYPELCAEELAWVRFRIEENNRRLSMPL